MAQERRVYTVTQLNRYLKALFEDDFVLRHIRLKGEVSNLKYHSSGHIYFTLKDSASQVAAVMFAGDRAGLPFKLENGMQVEAEGSVGVYEKNGSYQLYVRYMEPAGRGALYLRFEQLKTELAEMGMFDPMYKKPVPPYAMRIGIVTSDTGAAVRDIIQIATRRNPYVELILCPAQVQGEGAAASIVRGIRRMDREGVDVMIVGRGGGSLEDLWAFNEEAVAHAIFEAQTPLISAVGHEVDYTIADFVADLRAPTPSAAAELAVFEYADLEALTEACRERLTGAIYDKLERGRGRLREYALRFSAYRPDTLLAARRQQLERAQLRLSARMRGLLDARRHQLSLQAERMEKLSPLLSMQRGFAYVSDEADRRVRRAQELTPGQSLQLQFVDGRVLSRVEEVTLAGYTGEERKYAEQKDENQESGRNAGGAGAADCQT